MGGPGGTAKYAEPCPVTRSFTSGPGNFPDITRLLVSQVRSRYI